MLRHSLYSLAAGLAIVAPQAAARNVDHCASEGFHHDTKAPWDLGRGFVVTESGHEGYHSDADDWGAFQIEVQDCKSGQRVEMRTAAQKPSGAYRFNQTTRVRRMLDDLKDLPRDQVLDQFERRASRAGAKVREKGVIPGGCGCKAYYPEFASEASQ